MKVYIVFEGSLYSYSNGDIKGVFLLEKDALDMQKKIGGESFIEKHKVKDALDMQKKLAVKVYRKT